MAKLSGEQRGSSKPKLKTLICSLNRQYWKTPCPLLWGICCWDNHYPVWFIDELSYDDGHPSVDGALLWKFRGVANRGRGAQ